ncbi:NACHT and TPR domain-containing protein [Purpureocillium lilacinum]|uniref:NACHT and TPR domain-containing protein n=1 Tax=Purpureocillium lilacinum TaxID=33203 RepID=A0A179GAJ0_PURLI|nr:NACHT and TPR domain-containing protein [Purpureocillium lilacinum]
MAGDNKQTPPGMERQFADVLESAAKLYKDNTGEALSLQSFTTPPMRTVEDLKLQLSRQNEDFAAFRAKRQNLFSVLSAALKPVEVVGEVVAGAASDAFAPAQNIYAAVLYLVNAAHNVSATYDAIVELFEQLKDFTPRLEVYVKHHMSPGLYQKLASILASLFEVLVLASKEIRRGRVKAYFKRLVGFESPVQSALERLKVLTVGEERQVVADTYGGVSQLNAKADQIDSAVAQVSQSVQSMRLEQREWCNLAVGEKLRKILAPSPFPEDLYNAFKKSTVPGTGDWITQDEGVSAWFSGEKPYLWISGNAGTGKSFLTSRIISWKRDNLDESASVGYFFFRANNPETRSVVQALRDVAYQLSESDGFYAKDLMQRLHSREDIKTVSSAFRQLFPVDGGQETSRRRYIFLDGIDEANQDDIKELLSALAPGEGAQQPTIAPQFQFALVGRSYLSDIVTAALDPPVPGQTLTTVQVSSDRSAKDVSAFIYDSILHSRVLSRTSADFKKTVIQALEKQADGLFIVAKFMLDDVNRKRHQSSILESLESYPKEIDGVLQKTLDNLVKTISKEEARDLNEMLRWVTCAEEVLTLEQLEAALIMEFGDPPLFLEESLRRQYACFFELEREDGLTTDDLVKDYDRARRDLNRDLSPARRISPGRSLSVGENGGLERRLSPAGRGSPSRHSSPGNGRFSPRQVSPAHGSDILDSASDVEFRSNKYLTRVTFFHTSVREFFRSGRFATSASEVGAAIGFDITEARIHILRACLKVFADREWFEKLDLGQGMAAMKQYAAWYWQEHVAAIDPANVSSQHKRDLGPQLYRMLTDEDVVFDWSIMYEKNDEGLEVLTDHNIKGLQRWFRDADVVDGLDPAGKTFAKAAGENGSGVCEQIGRFYARAWLASDFGRYVPTLFCFKIVQNVTLMDAGYDWSHAGIHWPDISVEDRLNKATVWAAQPETAHWHRRVGSTYLTLAMHAHALKHYDSALKLDNNSVETSGRIAFCLYQDRRYGTALDQALECAAIEDRNIQSGTLQGAALGKSKWRLYKDCFLIAQCAYRMDKVDIAHKYFRKAIENAEGAALEDDEFLQPGTGYFEVLASEGLHGEMMELAEEMSRHFTKTKHGQNRFVDLLLERYFSLLVMDWLPRAAAKTGKVEFLLSALELAIEVADIRLRETLVVLHLRLAHGTTFEYSRDIDNAIAVLEQIALQEYRPRGSITTRQAYAVAFQKLATLYKQKIIDVGWASEAGRSWVSKMEVVQRKQDRHHNFNMPADMLGSDVNVASIYLACFYRLLGRESEATGLLKALIQDSLDILSDSEPGNDVYALDNLLRVFIAAGEVSNAIALARSMRKVNPEASFSTIGESPEERRGAPKLPDIQSYDRTCFQCFNNVASGEEFAMCRFCMESYCTRCLEKVIKAAGNKTGETGVAGAAKVVCRSDHDWFTVPPLNRLLHTGEIMLEDGRVHGFEEWKDEVRKAWGLT